MNTTTLDTHQTKPRTTAPNAPPVGVQVLAVIGFGVFSIVAVSVAFAENWIAGMVLAIVLAWAWTESRAFARPNSAEIIVDHSVKKLAPTVDPSKSSGNASFDAYRADMMKKLEQESRDFEEFLTRLREARDASEFEQYMDDRAKSADNTSD